jgi:large subunit ribosomal protein L10
MPVTKQKKADILKDLDTYFNDAKSVVFTNYKGVSVKDISTLRRQLSAKDCKFKVAKKTLIKIAAAKAGFKDIPDESFEGQVGAAFSKGDEIAAAKILYDFSKTHEQIKLLGALMEGRALTKAETMVLAKLPGREELLARLVGSIKAPVSNFHGLLYALLRNFVGVVSAYKEKMEKGGAA